MRLCEYYSVNLVASVEIRLPLNPQSGKTVKLQFFSWNIFRRRIPGRGLGRRMKFWEWKMNPVSLSPWWCCHGHVIVPAVDVWSRWLTGFWLAAIRVCGRFNLFTSKSDQFQISPAASPEILHHTVWRTWLCIAYSDGSDERWLYSILRTSFIHLSFKGWENVLFELGSERVIFPTWIPSNGRHFSSFKSTPFSHRRLELPRGFTGMMSFASQMKPVMAVLEKTRMLLKTTAEKGTIWRRTMRWLN